MSVRVMSIIWDKFPHGGARLMMMLALADWANDDGANIFPSIETLARKVRVSRRPAQETLRMLESDGYIEVVANRFGGAPGATRHLRINLPLLRSLSDWRGAEISTGVEIRTGAEISRKRVLKSDKTGAENRTQTISYPSVEPNCMPAKLGTVCVPIYQVIESYDERCPTLAGVKLVTDSRKQAIRHRWMQAGRELGRYDPSDVEAGLAWWSRFFDAVDASPFLSGRDGRWASCNLDWLMKQANFCKVIEGNYARKVISHVR